MLRKVINQKKNKVKKTSITSIPSEKQEQMNKL